MRHDLAAKLARLVPGLGASDQKQTARYVVEALEILTRDQAVRVRRILAETLRDVAQAPPSVIQALARDVEQVVACPVLEFSPLLNDRDLIDIIGGGCVSGKLAAISRRRGLGSPVCDAIVATDDRDAITALLANDSTQIREETLDALVDQSRSVETWQEPLVERPALPSRMVLKLAGFVAGHLLERLRGRDSLDQETTRLVAEEVGRRLAADEAAEEVAGETAAETARRLFDGGELDDDAVFDALSRGDRGLVRNALGLLSGLDEDTVARILDSGSAKGITALAWKAGLAMRIASQIQLRMGGLGPSKVLNARGGTDYPLTPEEMTWQLEFFATLSE